MNTPQSLQQIAACVSGYDPNALPVEKAQAFIAQLVPRVQAEEHRPIRDALGRVLAHDIVSAIDVPAHDNSAMDGFALRGSELLAEVPTQLRIVGSGLAGQNFDGEVPAHGCVRITTGAVMPRGLDTVVPQEFTSAGPAGQVSIPPGVVRAGDNRRLAGEDLTRGEPALSAGRVLRPADLGLLASLGLAEVPVRRRLRVAFFSTGDELRSIGEPLDTGCVYDSNRYTLWGMLQRLGVDAIDMGVVRDEPRHWPRYSPRRRPVPMRSSPRGRERRRGRLHEEDHGRTGRSAVLEDRHAARPPDGHRAHRPSRPPGHPVRPARQSGGGNGHLLCLRARRAAAHGRRHAAAAADAACGQRCAHPQEAWPHRVSARHRQPRGRWRLAGGDHRLAGQRHPAQHEPGQRHGAVAPRTGDVAAGELVDVLPFDGLL